MNGKNLDFNIGKSFNNGGATSATNNVKITTKEIINTGSVTAGNNIYLFETTKIACAGTGRFEAKKIYVNDPSIFTNANCKLKGEVVRIPDVGDMASYENDPVLVEYHSQHHSEL